MHFGGNLTIQDVSTSTVSRVSKNQGGVRKETEEKIDEIHLYYNSRF